MVPANSSAMLEMMAGGEDIEVHASGQDFESESGNATIPLGEGGAYVSLTAGGDITVTDQQGKNWEFDDDLNSMDDHWDDFGIQIEQGIREGLKSVQESVRMATQHAANAGKMAEEKMNQAMRHLEERGITAGRKRKVVGFSFGDADFPPPAKGSWCFG